ncbi:hypothetical protein C3F09_00570 [candidate division GN15 bacterium]|uniref:Uncharacterized protein n=1 Tax=candidate division GN15 bacterium TaxID=2072418 RepID=A0A855X5C5_9BACT|nr:MAG: hypothetical protein C3F09_00570 [candidate division GN15 bacterium]
MEPVSIPELKSAGYAESIKDDSPGGGEAGRERRESPLDRVGKRDILVRSLGQEIRLELPETIVLPEIESCHDPIV